MINVVYVLDTSVLIELHNRYYPEVFVSLWDEIEKLVENEEAVSIKEVQNELFTKGAKIHWNQINIDYNNQFFRELDGEAVGCMQKIEELPMYHAKLKSGRSLEQEWGFGTAVADPFLICHGLYHESTVVTMENPDKAFNIPQVCKKLDVKCIGLKDFLLENEFRF